MSDLIDELTNWANSCDYQGEAEILLRAAEEIQRLRELLDFALDGLDSTPRSWGLKITHSDNIRRRLEQEQEE